MNVVSGLKILQGLEDLEGLIPKIREAFCICTLLSLVFMSLSYNPVKLAGGLHFYHIALAPIKGFQGVEFSRILVQVIIVHIFY